MTGRWFFCFILILSTAARAENLNTEWSARSWQSDEGLPDNAVVEVAQGGDGFLWVATRSGLARFDEIGRASCRERVYSSV